MRAECSQLDVPKRDTAHPSLSSKRRWHINHDVDWLMAPYQNSILESRREQGFPGYLPNERARSGGFASEKYFNDFADEQPRN